MVFVRIILCLFTSTTIGIVIFILLILFGGKTNNKNVQPVTKQPQKEKLDKEDVLKTLGIAMFMSLLILPFAFLAFLGLYEDTHLAYIQEIQKNNCLETTTKDGNRLTADQCKYYMNIVNGSYADNDGIIDLSFGDPTRPKL